jgi:NADH-quinone oxidoreductase subunit J
MVLFTKYLIPFEVAAVMLLVAMIGGIILAGKKMDVSYSELTENEIDAYEAELERVALEKEALKKTAKDRK